MGRILAAAEKTAECGRKRLRTRATIAPDLAVTRAFVCAVSFEVCRRTELSGSIRVVRSHMTNYSTT